MKDKIKRKPQVRHGLSYHPLYKIYIGIKTRCYRKKSVSWHLYGGAGVVMCDEWKSSFVPFYDWAIKNGWQKGLEIDKDKLSPTKPGKIYSPEYCCFLTKSENNNNRSNTVYITFNGQRKLLSEWALIHNISLPLLHNRIFKLKMSLQRAFTLNVKSHKKRCLIEYNGDKKTLAEWCKLYNQPLKRVEARLRKGWLIEKALNTLKNDSYNTDKRGKK